MTRCTYEQLNKDFYHTRFFTRKKKLSERQFSEYNDRK